MFTRTLNRLFVSLAALTTFTPTACGEVQKDVPFVRTPQPVVEEMLRLAAPKEGEILYDLGCGDGRIVITAAKSTRKSSSRRESASRSGDDCRARACIRSQWGSHSATPTTVIAM